MADWLRFLLRGLRSPAGGEIAELDRQRLIGVMDEGFRQVLEDHGFEHVSPRKWVRSLKPHMREVVGIEPSKGSAYWPIWGISLDFVPLVRRRLSWKRSAKIAYPDLRLEAACPDEVMANLGASYLPRGDPDEALARYQRIAVTAAHLAVRDFDKVRSLSDVAEGFSEWMARPFTGLGPGNYSQTAIAHGLVLIATGRSAEGETIMAPYVEHALTNIDPNDPLLSKAKVAALKLAQPHPSLTS